MYAVQIKFGKDMKRFDIWIKPAGTSALIAEQDIG